MNFMRMQWIVKDFISRVNGISDDYYFVYPLELCCYNSKTLVLVNKKTLYWVNIRELDRELHIRLSILYTNT